MKFLPTYVCPNCGKIMKISGEQCPACQFSFTLEMVNHMLVVCPDCLSKELKVEFTIGDTPLVGMTITDIKYAGLLEMAQEAVNRGAIMNFQCKCCGSVFDEQSFLLFPNPNNMLNQEIEKKSDAVYKATKFGCLPRVIALFIVSMVLIAII
jgi:ribosomal protein L37AE/L43A